jgi:small conductance mechanosensitive channel
MDEYIDLVWKWLISSGARILVILVLSFILIRVTGVLTKRAKSRMNARFKGDIEHTKRTETLTKLIRKTVKAVVLAAAVLMVLQNLGVNIGPLLAGAGIVGLAVGFGAQSLVKDVISGFFILLENHMNVGDVVEVAGSAGLVESINLRVTKLRDYSGNVHIIPNGQIAVLMNMTKGYSRAVLDIGVAYKENVDEVMEVMKEVAGEMEKEEAWSGKFLEPMEMVGLDSFGDSSVNIKVRFTVKPLEQWNVSREYRRRLKNVFDDKGIEIPFPHVTLYMGEGENTGALKVMKSGEGASGGPA